LPAQSAGRRPEVPPEERQYLESGGAERGSGCRRWGNPTAVYLDSCLLPRLSAMGSTKQRQLPAGTASSQQTVGPGHARLEAVDRLRGLVMILMTLDHVRGYFTNPFLDPTGSYRPGRRSPTWRKIKPGGRAKRSEG
jgi:hypothetical protein